MLDELYELIGDNSDRRFRSRESILLVTGNDIDTWHLHGRGGYVGLNNQEGQQLNTQSLDSGFVL